MGKKGESKYFGVFTKGQKFGKYTVVNGEVVLKRESQILCLCDCGTENYVSCWTLKNGKSKGCLKCNNPRPGEKNPLWGGYENISGKYYGRIKRNAEKRNIVFDLSIEYLNQVLVEQNFKCKLSQVPIYFSHSKKDNYEATASVDRINSNLGYIIGNIQWIHKDVNLMKNHFNQEYFIELCKKISDGK
jgi:hypothetical protein